MIRIGTMAIALGLFALSQPVWAEPASDSPLAVDLSVTLASKYLFQGIDYSDGYRVAQPEATLRYGNVSATAWFNVDLHRHRTDEIDLVFQYEHTFGRLSLAPGYAYYRYPHRGWDPSHEVLLDLALDTVLAPTLSAHYDFDEGDGSYFTLGFSRSLAVGAGTLNLATNVFYQQNYYQITGIPSVEMNVGYALALGRVTLTPSVSYFATWENGDFQGDNAVPSTWLIAIAVGVSRY